MIKFNFLTFYLSLFVESLFGKLCEIDPTSNSKQLTCLYCAWGTYENYTGTVLNEIATNDSCGVSSLSFLSKKIYVFSGNKRESSPGMEKEDGSYKNPFSNLLLALESSSMEARRFNESFFEILLLKM